jgi:hypothetical protein
MINYFFYYYWNFCFIWQYGKNYKEFGWLLDYYSYFCLKFHIFKAERSRVPALFIRLIILGVGFEFCTHAKR